MKTRVLLLIAIVAGWPTVVGAQHAAPLTPQDSALHVLNRLAYGPRPGEIERVARAGVLRWIDAQLAPDKIDDQIVARREREFDVLKSDRGDLARLYAEVQRARQERKRMGDTAADKPDDSPVALKGRRLAAQFQQLAVVRAALSERQLYEVMVDFWTNHFNVYFAKGADRFLTPDYIEHTIRRHAMGAFEDLLIATAQSPAMLFYLDNWESVAPGATPPQAMRLQARPLFGRRPPLFPPPRDRVPTDSMRQRAPRGINENYARELLELHTLGVDGGYDQHDVIEVARIFTGWSIKRPQQGGDFEFHDWAHDTGDKQVLGVEFARGHGMEEGIRLLKLLANHPATMHHVSRKLCQRFVNDDPPDGCVDDAVAAWQRRHGDIREVLRAIFQGPDFWAATNVRTKVKTPLEFVVSAMRAVVAEPDTSPRLAQVVARLGEPLYLHVAPDGYPEREDAWVNSAALLERMNAAMALAAGKVQGMTVALDSIDSVADIEALIGAIDDRILGGTMSQNTKQVLTRQLSGISDPMQARALAVGLALGGPEFQRQ